MNEKNPDVLSRDKSKEIDEGYFDLNRKMLHKLRMDIVDFRSYNSAHLDHRSWNNVVCLSIFLLTNTNNTDTVVSIVRRLMMEVNCYLCNYNNYCSLVLHAFEVDLIKVKVYLYLNSTPPFLKYIMYYSDWRKKWHIAWCSSLELLSWYSYP